MRFTMEQCRAPEITPNINQHGVVMCTHDKNEIGEEIPHVKVVGAWGNAVWICHRCLRPVHRYLTPTAL